MGLDRTVRTARLPERSSRGDNADRENQPGDHDGFAHIATPLASGEAVVSLALPVLSLDPIPRESIPGFGNSETRLL